MSDHVPKAISVQNHLSKHSETNILLGPREREMLGVKKALKIARKKTTEVKIHARSLIALKN